MSTMVGFRGTGRSRTRVGGKALTSDKTTLVNLDNKRAFRDLVRHGSIASTSIQVVAPFFQNDDGVVEQGGAVTNRATGLVLDVSAVHFTRASGAKGTGAAGTATVGAADATNPRVDTVVVDTTSGAFSVIAGTATAGASLFNLQGKGAVPANRIVLAYVLVPATATNLTAANVADARP
jgi:hypothetical protein